MTQLVLYGKLRSEKKRGAKNFNKFFQTGQAIANTQRAIEGNVKTQLIAHDKEVYDIEFSKLANGREIFASVGMFLERFICEIYSC